MNFNLKFWKNHNKFIVKPIAGQCGQGVRLIERNAYGSALQCFRETTGEDVEEFAKIYGDSEITKYTDGILDIYTEKKYVNAFREKEYELRGFGIWTVIRRKDNRVIGRCGFDVRAGFDEPEAGYVMGKEFQNKGYATEALKAALSFARKKELGKINAFVMSGNEASKRVLEKCGFSFVGSKEINQKSYEQWQTKN